MESIQTFRGPVTNSSRTTVLYGDQCYTFFHLSVTLNRQPPPVQSRVHKSLINHIVMFSRDLSFNLTKIGEEWLIHYTIRHLLRNVVISCCFCPKFSSNHLQIYILCMMIQLAGSYLKNVWVGKIDARSEYRIINSINRHRRLIYEGQKSVRSSLIINKSFTGLSGSIFASLFHVKSTIVTFTLAAVKRASCELDVDAPVKMPAVSLLTKVLWRQQRWSGISRHCPGSLLTRRFNYNLSLLVI